MVTRSGSTYSLKHEWIVVVVDCWFGVSNNSFCFLFLFFFFFPGFWFFFCFFFFFFFFFPGFACIYCCWPFQRTRDAVATAIQALCRGYLIRVEQFNLLEATVRYFFFLLLLCCSVSCALVNGCSSQSLLGCVGVVGVLGETLASGAEPVAGGGPGRGGGDGRNRTVCSGYRLEAWPKGESIISHFFLPS